MSYSLDGRLVVGVASSALFDLAESEAVFAEQGVTAYREFQDRHFLDPLAAGVAFPFIRRLLSLNDLAALDDPLVEVIVLSRNDPDTGMRVMQSIEHHGLPITRAIFTGGKSPWQYMSNLGMALFLTCDRLSVRAAIEASQPAGFVLPTATDDDPADRELRIGFDFDGVLADDAAERVFQQGGLAGFQLHEETHAAEPLKPGPLKPLLGEICRIQAIERNRRDSDPNYQPRLRTSIITARSAPAHKRAVNTLKSWGVMVDDAFFLGGIDKSVVTSVMRPHIFFDDQERHLSTTSDSAPSVHVPFGTTNVRPE